MTNDQETKERANPFNNLPAIGGGSRLTGGPDTCINLSSLSEVWRFAEIISGSELVPKQFKGSPASVLLAIEWGIELGIPPLQALQNIAVINGKPSIYGDLGMALVQQRAGIDLVRFETSYDAEKKVARVVIERQNPSGKNVIADESFSWQDAVAAGLAGKDTYKAYANNMLTWRAFWRAARRTYSDLLRGMQGFEEGDAAEVLKSARVTVSEEASELNAALTSSAPEDERSDPTETSPSAGESEPSPEPSQHGEPEEPKEASARARIDAAVGDKAKDDEWLDRECRWAFGSNYDDLDDKTAAEVLEHLTTGVRLANVGLRTRADVAKEIGRWATKAELDTDGLKELAAENDVAYTGQEMTKMKSDDLAKLLDAVRMHAEMVG